MATKLSRREAKALQKEQAITAALDLAEREGSSALTMRRLGEEISVDPTVLYRLFQDKDELLLAVFDRTLGMVIERAGPFEEGLGWRCVLRRLADANWQVKDQYPAIWALMFARISRGSAEHRIVEMLLSALSATGLPPERTVLYYRVYADTVLSLCGQSATVLALDPQLRDKDERSWLGGYGRSPGEDFPVTLRHAALMPGVAEREVFDGAVEAVIGAIEAAITRTLP